MKTQKKQDADYLKLMKAMVKLSKGNRLFTEYDSKNEIVYLSDSHIIMPIPKSHYVKNSDVAKCPSFDVVCNSKIELKKFIMENWNNENKIQCKKTSIILNLSRIDERLANVYKCGDTFGVVDKRFVDLIDLLPDWLSSGYSPYALDTKSPLVFYSDIMSMGYAILPIYCNVEDIFDRLGFTKKTTD